ncbi:uncharacterized protein F4807DRAFT_466077 [Annulohypoxylon truncatum]|uniref:uncharacterized protein n=1 Tax=Annulohypoxylon truncatum TaxID=327061 RepID=UPI0020077038|nr:uncharacterized protein F4807DRAFT_466077 [Annulohypoxylon truncatum]KAI1204052.1 hypothetical protein F4807DRAFT_466077 [Annulohypoxylon truncatum]
MDFTSSSAAPPSSPPLPPQSTQQHTSQSPLPDPTSELSDIPTITPTVSAFDENDTDEDDTDPIPLNERPSPDQVVDETIQFWHNKWRTRAYNIERFLEGCILSRSGSRTRAVNNVLKKPSIQKRLEELGIRIQFKDDADREIADISAFRDELSALLSQDSFSKFDPEAFKAPDEGPCAIKDVCNTEWIENSFRQAGSQILAKSPRIAAFLSAILANQRADWKSYNSGKANASFPVARAYLIMALILNSQAPYRSNFLPHAIGIYLHSSGVQRRVIETLARFGISSGYKAVTKQLKRMAEQSRLNIKRVAHDPSAVFVYDNFNFKDKIRDLSLGRKSVMRNLTNCLIVASPDVHGPFLQSQWHATIPFNRKWLASYIMPPPECEPEAIKYLMVDSVRSVLNLSSLEKVAPFPELARPQHNVSYVLQTPAIHENEGEIAGVYRVHDTLFHKILEYKEYEDRLTIIHGDQKTTSFIRAIVAAQLEARNVYDRKQWILPVPAFFHIVLNFIHLIFRTFWDPLIERDVQFFGRGQHIKKDHVLYHHGLPLLRDAFNSRILAFLIQNLVDTGVLHDDQIRPGSIREALAGIDPALIEQRLSVIQAQVFGSQAWKGQYTEEKSDPIDVEFRSLCRYMIVISYLLMMVTAVQLGDYGVLRQIIPQLPLFFFGAKSNNYGPEMLYFAWLLHTDVTEPELATGILRSGLVRCTTAGSGWKAIDLALEHINGAFAIDIKNNKNSTRNVSIMFDHLSVIGPYTASIRGTLERSLNTTQKGRHTTPSTNRDVMEYACKIYVDGDTKRRLDGYSISHSPYDAPDILYEGLKHLANTKIDEFNMKVVRPIRASTQQNIPALRTEDGFVESNEGRRLYGSDQEEDSDSDE